MAAAESMGLDSLLAADGAIHSLASVSERAAETVRSRFYGGGTGVGAAEIHGISERPARREWTFVRAWLFRRSSGSQD